MITGIGSLPHVDLSEATSFVLRTTPLLPAAPSLPPRDPREGMLAQAAWGMTGVTVTAAGELVVDDRLDPTEPFPDDDSAAPTGPPFAAFHAFLAGTAVSPPPRLKLQLTGPLTLGLALIRAGAPITQAFAAAAGAVAARTTAMVRLARQHLPATAPVVFLDEPAFVGVGRPGFPLGQETAIDVLSGALAALEHSAMTGVHCCGAADWSAVLRAGPNVLSLPVELAATLNEADVAQHLDSGGWIAWGAVPTDRPLAVNADRYWRTLSARLTELAGGGVIDRTLLHRRAIITPACGLAQHTVDQAERVFALCAEIDARLRTRDG